MQYSQIKVETNTHKISILALFNVANASKREIHLETYGSKGGKNNY